MDGETKEKIVYNILKKYAKNNGLVEYRYPDGFYCFGNPDSQEMADKKHEEWLDRAECDITRTEGAAFAYGTSNCLQ